MPTATKRARQNGSATEALETTPPATVPATGPREAREEEWHDLQGAPGFQVKLWANFPGSLWNTVVGAGVTEDQRRTALRRVVLAHNDWADTEGQPYPDAQAADFYEKISNRLLRRIMRTIMEAQTTLPNFPMPTPRT